MTHRDGHAPAGGWARLAPALTSGDLKRSLRFWQDVLGFRPAYQRPEDEFAYLELDSAQVMLYQRCDMYETGVLEKPFGRGVMIQIQVADLDRVLSTLEGQSWPLYHEPREAWYRAGDVERGLRHFHVQDPDGYLLMIYQEIGVRRRD